MLSMQRAGFRLSLVLVASLGLAGCIACGGVPVDHDALSSPRPVTFAATGDGPRGEEDWTLLPQYFAAEKADGRARYLIHVGDLCKGSQLFDAAYSAKVADLYRQSSIPVILVPGDNEWNDQANPDAAWALWEKHFLRFSEQFPESPKLNRQEGRPENIAWMDGGVLFVGINIVSGRMHDVEEWGYRHRANADWVEHNLDTRGRNAYAVVVIGQAAPKAYHEDFFRRFVPAVEAFGKPVLYLHGDGHVWEYEDSWRAPNLLRIQVDQVTKARPVHITVSPEDPQHPFSYDRLGAESKVLEGK
ncbi:MAG: metallophosphoesterase [Candidatus Hydrogenedentes bacterium]|nr:metallophosphoesterase [Candidatus Hydrogenedentota bacterium]